MKTTGGERVVVRLDRLAAARYAAAVAPLVPSIEGSLGPEVFGNRVRGRGRVRTVQLEPWRPARRAFEHAVGSLAGRAELLLFADVLDCYPSMEEATITRTVRSRGDRAAVLGALEVTRAAGIQGLPVGPDPSAILANGVLAAIDGAIHAMGLRHVRWVDDLVVALPDERRAVATLDAMREALASIGLRENVAKTRLVAADLVRTSNGRDRHVVDPSRVTERAAILPAGG